jgi:hypothetical protein
MFDDLERARRMVTSRLPEPRAVIALIWPTDGTLDQQQVNAIVRHLRCPGPRDREVLLLQVPDVPGIAEQLETLANPDICIGCSFKRLAAIFHGMGEHGDGAE